MTSEEALQCYEACQAEMASLKLNGTWKLIPLEKDMSVLKSKWVFTYKTNADEAIERQKARVVAKGCSQEYVVDYHETFGPVARVATIRIFLTFAALYALALFQAVAIEALLIADLEERIFMKPVEELRFHPLRLYEVATDQVKRMG